jgi:hypothetical protein
MLVVCICSLLNLVLRYKFYILITYHTDSLYLREQGCEDPWLFYEAKRGSASKKSLGTLAYSKNIEFIVSRPNITYQLTRLRHIEIIVNNMLVINLTIRSGKCSNNLNTKHKVVLTCVIYRNHYCRNTQ